MNDAMKTTNRYAFVLIIMSLVLSSCSGVIPVMPILQQPEALLDVLPLNLKTPMPVLVDVPADATATPTPFQPIPPTAVFTPTIIPTLTAFPTSTPPPAMATAMLPAEPIPILENQTTILLLGSDKRPWDSGFRTDTIILLVLNPTQGTVSLLSFPRDLYVYIPGWTQDRINTAFYHGGFKTLAATLQQNFGVKPDHYVLINFRSFKQIIDSLGGLDVKVGQPLYDRIQGKGWVTIKKGLVNMDADMVLWYSRSRKTTNDFARNRRQQEVLVAMFEKFLSLDALKRLPELYKMYKKSVSTDLGLTDGLAMLPLALQLVDTSRIKRYYVSPQHVWDYITPGGAMVLMPREAEIRKLVKQAMNGK
jgi:LCP family protein required for cell wall assembly